MEIKPHIAKLAEALSEQKIKWAFGVTGGGASLELITALNEKGIKYYPVAHEAAAVMMAGACSKDGITRAAAITIKGPGFANALPGILSNNYEARPAITISEAYSPATPAHKTHKRLDHFAASVVFVKAFSAVDDSGKNFKRNKRGHKKFTKAGFDIGVFGFKKIGWHGLGVFWGSGFCDSRRKRSDS